MENGSTKRGLARSIRRRDNREGYAFIAPAAVFIAVFGIFPILYSVFMSLHKWRIVKGAFVGLDNYATIFGDGSSLVFFATALVISFVYVLAKKAAPGIFSRRIVRAVAGGTIGLAAAVLVVCGFAAMFISGDPDFVSSFRITFWYSLGTVPFQLAFGFFIAVLVDRARKAKEAFRVIFLLPYIVPAVSSAAIFTRLFSLRPESLANQVLAAFGAQPLQWLGESKGVVSLAFQFPYHAVEQSWAGFGQGWLDGPSLALVAVMIFNYWIFTGYYALIFSHGLSQIPKDINEAAALDGAGTWGRMWRITIPLVSPTTYFLTLLGIIGTFKSFTYVYVLRNQASLGSSDPLSVYIFDTFFRHQNFGLAAAQAIVLMTVMILLSVWQQRVQERRVHYDE